jgi:hypothetical protein
VPRDQGAILFKRRTRQTKMASIQSAKSGLCPRALSKSGAREPPGVALFIYCNGLVGRVRPSMSAGPPAPATGPRTNGGGLDQRISGSADQRISGGWCSHGGAEARRKQRKEPTTRHRGNWRVPCSCLCVKQPWLPTGVCTAPVIHPVRVHKFPWQTS